MLFKQHEIMLLTVKIFITDQQKAELDRLHDFNRYGESELV